MLKTMLTGHELLSSSVATIFRLGKTFLGGKFKDTKLKIQIEFPMFRNTNKFVNLATDTVANKSRMFIAVNVYASPSSRGHDCAIHIHF